jgi:hypothetical protein
MKLHVGPIEVYMNEFITPPRLEKPRVSPASELARIMRGRLANVA